MKKLTTILLVLAVIASFSFVAYDKLVARSLRFTEALKYGTPGDSSLLYKRSDGLVGSTDGASGELVAGSDSVTVVNGIITAIH